MRPFTIIAAASKDGGIGFDGQLPWHLKNDMQAFRTTTTVSNPGSDGLPMNAVVVGRKTWQSIPAKNRPLSKRLNIVIGKTDVDGAPPDLRFDCLADALKRLAEPPFRCQVESVFVIGGTQLYDEAITMPECRRILLTRIDADFRCDRFFPKIPAAFKQVSIGKPVVEPNLLAAAGSPLLTHRLETYERLDEPAADDAKSAAIVRQPIPSRNDEERQYLDAVADVIKTGVRKADRTGTGTLSKFGHQFRFSLKDGRFPLLTTKRVAFRAVAEELFWMLGGSTDAKELAKKKVHIWNANGSRAFLDKLGFTDREEGDLGPIYGFQWRHFGAKYTNSAADYTGQGVDQIAEIIRLIKTEPYSRRILLSAWNPTDLKQMALPPCHVSMQFTVVDGYLSCMMYQRSCDLGLGVPFNLASYSLLTVLLADFCGLKAGEFIHTLGDYHVYANHIDPLTEQVGRTPRPFPTLRITKNKRSSINDYCFDDLLLDGYDPMPAVAMPMAV